ncbi:MAG: hypothetical protein R3D05_02075 [Dongiaceae bacterium]
MLAFKTFCATATAALIASCPAMALADHLQPENTDVTVIGLDGKPLQSPVVDWEEVGDMYFHDGKGEGINGSVLIIHAFEKQTYQEGEKLYAGTTVVYVPDGSKSKITIQIKPVALFEHGAASATKGKNDGDAQLQQAGYDEAKAALEDMKAFVDSVQRAIDEWAKANGIPVIKQSELIKRIDKIRKSGAPVDSRLEFYARLLFDLEMIENDLKSQEKRFAELSPPDKKVSALPSACPEGQSGGLLAGLLNGVTGTNGFNGICDDKERQKDHKEREREHGDRDHGRED